MAYKIQFQLTRTSTDVPWSNLALAENDVGIVPNLVAEHSGTVEYSRSADELVNTIIYTFPDQSSWQTFYNAALPVWNRNSIVEDANNSGINIDVSVIENT